MAAEADQLRAGPGGTGHPGPAVLGVFTSPGLRMAGRRLLAAIPVLWGVTLLTFIVMNVLPGDAAQELLGANATPAEVHALELKLHLNEPFWIRYWHWLSGVLQGHLGDSLTSSQPVTSILAQRLPVTFELVLYGFAVSILLSVPVAVLAAHRPGGVADRISMVISMTGLSVAPYVLALLLVLVFAVNLRVLPAIGFVPLSQSVAGNIRSLTLPAVAIGFPLACFYTRLLRADIVEQMQSEDYVITAKAKGVSPWRVLVRHALRNSMFGFLTVIGLNLGTLIGATVIIEQIFSLPGIGQVLLQSINDRDVIVVEAVVLVFALVVVLANLLTDLLYSVLDPRIRYGRPTA
ncbi:MAG TPA: ABC transporter permease [Streptosporangiaceae bacterium]|jgi:peptide/nickel transport system permease protein